MVNVAVGAGEVTEPDRTDDKITRYVVGGSVMLPAPVPDAAPDQRYVNERVCVVKPVYLIPCVGMWVTIALKIELVDQVGASTRDCSWIRVNRDEGFLHSKSDLPCVQV